MNIIQPAIFYYNTRFLYYFWDQTILFSIYRCRGPITSWLLLDFPTVNTKDCQHFFLLVKYSLIKSK